MRMKRDAASSQQRRAVSRRWRHARFQSLRYAAAQRGTPAAPRMETKKAAEGIPALRRQPPAQRSVEIPRGEVTNGSQ